MKPILAKALHITIKIRVAVWLLLAVALLTVGIAEWFIVRDATLLDEWLRGMYLAVRLDALAGDGDTSAIDYTASDTFMYWGVETNSKWLVEYTFRILPFFEYEGIGGSPLPDAVAFVPMAGDDAFTIRGRAMRAPAYAFLNDRYVTIPDWGDDADALATLVHELLHLNKGNFIGNDPDTYEAFTEAATAEVLAAMCNYGDALACRAFASAMQGNVLSVLRRDMNRSGSDGLYQAFADVFMRRTEQERERAAKTLRWWQLGRWMSLMEIVNRYGVTPLERFILPGLRGRTFPSGVFSASYPGGRIVYQEGAVSFDDTAYLLTRWGLLSWFFGYGYPE